VEHKSKNEILKTETEVNERCHTDVRKMKERDRGEVGSQRQTEKLGCQMIYIKWECLTK
jgi:hypothetical protein